MDTSQGIHWNLYKSSYGRIRPKGYLETYKSTHVDGYIARDNLKFIQVLERTGKTQGMT